MNISQNALWLDNPGLKEFDISNYQGVQNRNFYHEDHLLQRIVKNFLKNQPSEENNAVINHLTGYGALVGGILNQLTFECHKEGKYGEIIHYDRSGNRIDKVQYSAEQIESRKISYEFGIVNLDFHSNWKFPFTAIHRYALAYLANQNGEGGVTCPLAMTDGMILALKEIGTPEQKKKYLPLVAGEDSLSYFMAGQYATERVGGSNVSANRTVAKKSSNGKWILNGEKWFCSNPGDLWVTTARIENTSTIGLFLVPRIKEEGSLNGCYLLRKKDIIGSKGKVTAEAAYHDLEAEELGRTTHGIANLIHYVVNVSRLHVGISATGMGRRAYMEAREYVQYREAYGKKIIEFPSVKRNLAEMHTMQIAVTICVFHNIQINSNKHLASHIITPLLKYISTVHSTWITREAILLHGGNGIIGDFSCLPRLHNDSIINETWEGTHQIITDHVIRAFKRNKVRVSFLEEMANLTKGYEAFLEKLKQNKHKNFHYIESAIQVLLNLKERVDSFLNYEDKHFSMNYLPICDRIFQFYAMSKLLEETMQDNGNGVFPYILTIYSEIVERGIGNETKMNGIFSNENALTEVVFY